MIFRKYIMILRSVLVFVDSFLLVFSLSPNSTVSAPNTPSPTPLYAYIFPSYALSLILAPYPLELVEPPLRQWVCIPAHTRYHGVQHGLRVECSAPKHYTSALRYTLGELRLRARQLSGLKIMCRPLLTLTSTNSSCNPLNQPASFVESIAE